MRQHEIEQKFLGYIEQTLPQAEMDQFASLLDTDKNLRKSFESYKQVFEITKQIASTEPKVSSYFESTVMRKISEKEVSFFRKLFMDLANRQRFVYGAVATLATLVVIVKSTEIGLKEGSYKETVAKELSQEVGNKVVQSGPVVARELSVKKEDSPTEARQQVLGNDKAKQDLRADLLKTQPIPVQPLEMKETQILKGNLERLESVDTKTVLDKSLTLNNDGIKSQEISPKIPKIEESELSYQDQKAKRAVGESSNTPVLSEAPADLAPAKIARDRGLAGGLVDSIRDEEEPSTLKPQRSFQLNNNSESYLSYAENPRFNVSSEPSSTFSIDVDTASYTNARRFLKEGQLPPKDSIRIEEFINYFDYNYPIQHEKPFTLSYEIAPSPLEQDRYLLKLGIKARDISSEIKPWNLVFLVDVSGSMMDANKLPLVKQSLKILVEKMRSEDKIAIVTYAGSAGVVLESSSIKEKAKIISAIEALSSGGSTNGSGGITAAYDLASKNMIANGVNRVVLATDGDFNVGVTSHEELIKLIEDKRKSGITLTGLGYGVGNIKDGTLEQLANKGNGNYFYIDSFQEARKVLETDLVGNMEVVAKDVKLQIEFNPDRVASYRLIGYENRKLKREDFNNDNIDAGEIGTGHTVTAMYEVILANSELAKSLADDYRYQKKEAASATTKEASSELAFLKIRFKEPDGKDSKLLQYPVEAKEVRSSIEQASNDFKFASAVSYFGQLLRGSQFVGKYSYKDVLALAETARGEDKKGYRQEFIELVKNARALEH